MNEFDTLMEACRHIAAKKLERYHVEYDLGDDVWVVLPNYNTTEDDDRQNDELMHLYLSEIAALGLGSDPHYCATSNHSPLTPDRDCTDCQRLGWVNVRLTVTFNPVKGIA